MLPRAKNRDDQKTEKTKNMVESNDLLRCYLEVEEKMMEPVIEFKYHGITLSSHGKLETKAEEQVNNMEKQTSKERKSPNLHKTVNSSIMTCC